MNISAIGRTCFLVASVGASSTPALASPAQVTHEATSAQQSSPISARAASPYLPPGVTLREIFRLYNGKHERNASLFHFPQNWDKFGWRRENTLGFISGTPFENSRPLYMCQLNGVAHAFFTSMDVKCEGQFLTSFGMIGYISVTPLPDTTPLYRCHYMFKGRLTHFGTTLANCGNIPSSANDGVMGYVFL